MFETSFWLFNYLQPNGILVKKSVVWDVGKKILSRQILGAGEKG